MTLANFSVKRVCPPVPPVEVINLEPGSEQGMKHLSASYYTVIVLNEVLYLTDIDALGRYFKGFCCFSHAYCRENIICICRVLDTIYIVLHCILQIIFPCTNHNC